MSLRGKLPRAKSWAMRRDGSWSVRVSRSTVQFLKCGSAQRKKGDSRVEAIRCCNTQMDRSRRTWKRIDGLCRPFRFHVSARNSQRHH